MAQTILPTLHACGALLIATCLVSSTIAQDSSSAAEAPSTVPERTAYAQTSTYADVEAFLEALEPLPHARRLRSSIYGESHEGRPLRLVTVANPMPAEDDSSSGGSSKLRLLINANIHAGEVEGKEAVQMLLREFALGQHAELLEAAVIYFVPIYNSDGNESIDKAHRVNQNGPDGGVGVRPNAQGFDLNRDFIKADSPECRALLGLFRELDPHLFMDLHTTNGSEHGYHLTYAPSLSTNVDPALNSFVRETFLPEVRAQTLEAGFRTFDYGNFSRRGEKSWSTYDHRPRFGTNYFGLRNRIAVLSEAYSYIDFEARVMATRAFVLENLRVAVARAEEIRKLCAQADLRVVFGDDSVRFGYDSRLAAGELGEVLVGKNEHVEIEGYGTRHVATGHFEPQEMRVRDAFESLTHQSLPKAWAVLAPTPEVTQNLLRHGLYVQQLEKAASVRAVEFEPSAVRRSKRPFQGHNEIKLEGGWELGEHELPAGTLIVLSAQPLGRLAAQLLEPLSEDSLSTWNFFEAQTRAASEDESGSYPVLRVLEHGDMQLTRVQQGDL